MEGENATSGVITGWGSISPEYTSGQKTNLPKKIRIIFIVTHEIGYSSWQLDIINL